MSDVWFRENDQRIKSWHLETLVSPDGMKAQYRTTHMPTDTLQVREFTGETAPMDADRAFTERAIELIHGGGIDGAI